MIKHKGLKERISIGLDATSKAQIGLEADKLELSLAEYVRIILDDRDKILNSAATSENEIEQETLDKLQIENKRLRILVENPSTPTLTEEQIEEIDALQSENEALRADMELLRLEVEESTSDESDVNLEEKLLEVEKLLQEKEEALANSQNIYETEKQTLVTQHKNEKQELIDELNTFTCSKMSEEEGELIAQYEEDFKGIVEKLRAAEAESTQQILLTEELREKFADYENQQVALADEELERFTVTQAKITQLEDELNFALYEKEGNKKVVESIKERGSKIQSKFDSLFYEHQNVKKELSKATQATEDLQEQLQQMQVEKEESTETLQSKFQTIKELKDNLEKATLQIRQLLTEQEDKEQLLEEIEILRKAAIEEQETWESTSNHFSQNAERAIRSYEKEMDISRELRSQCKQHEDLIAKYKVKLKQFINRINELETEKREQNAAPKSDAYSDLQISEFTEKEMKLYADCLEFLRGKHKDISNNNLLIASLYNSVKNKQSILVSTPYTSSLKAVVRNFRA